MVPEGRGHQEEAREGVDHYFWEDKGTVASNCVLWEAFITVIRGQAQALIGGKKKGKKLQMETRTREIGALAARLLWENTVELHHSLQARQTEHRALAEDSARKRALTTNRQLYDVGDKANKLLEWLDRMDQDQRGIWKIVDERGEVKRTGVVLAEGFSSYYDCLYASKSLIMEGDYDDFLKGITI
ncbi:hypothetical protein NDU88_003893 [Pleurodeles waltl]|uniref:Uncharacterized protein n=1 Tax=Pleurodeles waltl TaxID=8319 RepID=A0AAV7M5Z0_PLEWA|nr:hypothetical protein NDU88_000182 [Pleurodeles waltl]KAJ1098786.1 hypothetical protein NDU88_003893 [Pleurodeles waltl]